MGMYLLSVSPIISTYPTSDGFILKSQCDIADGGKVAGLQTCCCFLGS